MADSLREWHLLDKKSVVLHILGVINLKDLPSKSWWPIGAIWGIQSEPKILRTWQSKTWTPSWDQDRIRDFNSPGRVQKPYLS